MSAGDRPTLPGLDEEGAVCDECGKPIGPAGCCATARARADEKADLEERLTNANVALRAAIMIAADDAKKADAAENRAARAERELEQATERLRVLYTLLDKLSIPVPESIEETDDIAELIRRRHEKG